MANPTIWLANAGTKAPLPGAIAVSIETLPSGLSTIKIVPYEEQPSGPTYTPLVASALPTGTLLNLALATKQGATPSTYAWSVYIVNNA
jgi:hypothetical protein